MAADTVLMQVKSLISNDRIIDCPRDRQECRRISCESGHPVNFGCHPTSSHRYYNYDDVHLRLYLKEAAREEGFAAYMKQFVLEPATQDKYMRRVQNQEWIGEF